MKLFIFAVLLSGVTFASEELINAAKEGDLETVNNLIQKGENVNEADEVGVTPLIAAAMNKKFAVADALIKAKANVDQADQNLSTPLMHAARVGAVDIVLLLLTNGADPTLLNNNNPKASALNTALMAISDDKNLKDYKKIVKLLFQGSPQFGPAEIPALTKYLGKDPNTYIKEYSAAMSKLPIMMLERGIVAPLAAIVISYLDAEDNLALVALEVSKNDSNATAEKKVTVIHLPRQTAEQLYKKVQGFWGKIK